VVRGPFGSVLAVEKDEMRILHSAQDDDLKAVRSGCTLGIVRGGNAGPSTLLRFAQDDTSEVVRNRG